MPRDRIPINRRGTLKAAGAFAAAGVAPFTGCIGSTNGGDTSGGGSDSSSTTADQTASVVHGATQGGTTGILSTVMQEQGIAEKHGISLEPKLFASPPKVQKQLVFNEDIPTGYMGSIVATRMRAKDKNPQLVGPYMLNHTYVLAKSDSDVQKPTDLRGKNISFASTAADAWLKFVVMLDEAHGVARDEYKFTQAAPPAALSLLDKGELDAILSYEPLVTKALLKYDFHVVFSPRDAWRKQENLPLTTVDLAWTKNWYESNQDVANGLANAFIATQQYLNENMSSVVEKHKESFGLETKEQVKLAKERLADIYPAKWNKEKFQKSELTMVRKANERGLLDAEPTDAIFNWVI